MVDGLTKNKEESSKSLDVTLRQIYKIKKIKKKSKTYPSCLFIYLFFTCENVIGVQLHVHSVLLCYASYDPLGAAVLLSGQQPAQRLGEDPDRRQRRRKN